MFPLKEKLKDYVTEVKHENVGNSGFDGYVIEKIHIENALEIFEFWGYKPTVYDDVA